MVKSVNQQTKTIGHVQGEAIGDDSNKRTRLNSFCQIRVKDRSMRKTTLLSSEKCATSNFLHEREQTVKIDCKVMSRDQLGT